jgi:hypothetical protein
MYNKHMKHYLSLILVWVMIISLSICMLSQDARAQSVNCPYPGCFGGYALPYSYICTCNPYYTWMMFFPFQTNGITMSAAMAVPAAVSYSIFKTSTAQKYLGTYTPGVQSCWMSAPHGCYALPVYGTVMEITGVSEPGPF